MKILLIDVYHYYRGGAETVFFNTGELLKKAGHEVVYFTLKWPQNLPSEFETYFPESKESRKGPLRQWVNLVNYFYHFEAARNLRALIEKEKPDLAHIHLMWGQLTSSILKTLADCGVPAILTAHDYRLVCPAYAFRDGNGNICETCGGRRFYNCFLRRCSKGKWIESGVMAAEQYFRNHFFHPSRMLSGVIFVSDFSRSKHLAYMPELERLPMLTLHNMATELNPPKSEPDADRYFLYFGRLSQEKGMPTLVEAFARTPHLKLKIVGSGPLEPYVREQIASRGLKNIELLGFKRGAELTSLIRGAFFTLVTSECYENNPMSIVESYAQAVPVIGSRIGGIPEIIDADQTGFLFEVGDPESLAATLEKAATLTPESYLAMSANTVDYARRAFGAEVYSERLLDFYNRVIDNSKSQS